MHVCVVQKLGIQNLQFFTNIDDQVAYLGLLSISQYLDVNFSQNSQKYVLTAYDVVLPPVV